MLIDLFSGSDTVYVMAMVVALVTAVLAPFWLPALRAFRRHSWLPRPWSFVLAVASLSIGLIGGLYFAIFRPAQAYALLVAPTLQANGEPRMRWVVWGVELMAVHGWWLLPLALVALAAVITHQLASKWPFLVARWSSLERAPRNR